jgi:hypothetical protein
VHSYRTTYRLVPCLPSGFGLRRIVPRIHAWEQRRCIVYSLNTAPDPIAREEARGGAQRPQASSRRQAASRAAQLVLDWYGTMAPTHQSEGGSSLRIPRLLCRRVGTCTRLILNLCQKLCVFSSVLRTTSLFSLPSTVLYTGERVAIVRIMELALKGWGKVRCSDICAPLIANGGFLLVCSTRRYLTVVSTSPKEYILISRHSESRDIYQYSHIPVTDTPSRTNQ